MTDCHDVLKTGDIEYWCGRNVSGGKIIIMKSKGAKDDVAGSYSQKTGQFDWEIPILAMHKEYIESWLRKNFPIFSRS